MPIRPTSPPVNLDSINNLLNNINLTLRVYHCVICLSIPVYKTIGHIIRDNPLMMCPTSYSSFCGAFFKKRPFPLLLASLFYGGRHMQRSYGAYMLLPWGCYLYLRRRKQLINNDFPSPKHTISVLILVLYSLLWTDCGREFVHVYDDSIKFIPSVCNRSSRLYIFRKCRYVRSSANNALIIREVGVLSRNS